MLFLGILKKGQKKKIGKRQKYSKASKANDVFPHWIERKLLATDQSEINECKCQGMWKKIDVCGNHEIVMLK